MFGFGKKNEEKQEVEEVVQTPEVVEEEKPEQVEEIVVEEKKEEVIVENKKQEGKEKNFFASAFTAYLPIALAVIALGLHFLYGFMVFVDAYKAAEVFHLLANGTSIAAIIVEAIRQIKAKRFEFNPSLIIVLLTLFIVK